ncbi:hypothetical protein [Lentzea sp. NPDC092896]|uniref:hypothetical protein n=1 Tax=Lentzea sp. NPDC092896 TaxID=3364127 RepID=UPI0038007112
MRGDPRAVRVRWTFSGDQPSRVGRGHLLDGDLILTATGVTDRDLAAVRVQLAGSAQEYRCEVVWPAPETGLPAPVRAGAVVLRVTEPGWNRPPGLPPLRWGQLASNRPGCSVEVAGGLNGVVNVGAAAKRQRYHVTVERTYRSRIGDSSIGAAVLCNDLILGVVVLVETDREWAWLNAAPVPVLLAQPGFRELVGPVVAEAAELQPVLEHPELSGARPPPATDRVEVVSGLQEWCGSDSWFSVRLLVASNTSERTEFVNELLVALRNLGWSGGSLRESTARPDLDVAGHLTVPTLLVVDNSEHRSGQLLDLVEAVEKRSRPAGGAVAAAKVRILLLAADDGDWWEDLRSEHWLLRDLGPGVVMSLPARPR